MFEFGLVHGLWLSYVEGINRYRLQGTMFLERNHLFNSADLGLTVGALLGEKLPEEYCRKVNCHFAGTWGSLSAGVYNGGGYHGGEFNQNGTRVDAEGGIPADWEAKLTLQVYLH